jgi:hypothetical protein
MWAERETALDALNHHHALLNAQVGHQIAQMEHIITEDMIMGEIITEKIHQIKIAQMNHIITGDMIVEESFLHLAIKGIWLQDSIFKQAMLRHNMCRTIHRGLGGCATHCYLLHFLLSRLPVPWTPINIKYDQATMRAQFF